MNITLSARSKVLQLSSSGRPFRIIVTGDLVAGNHVDLEANAVRTPLDVTMCSMPIIIADLASANFLGDKRVDYDYNNQEFIISDRGNEH
jgi:hypothetical protein